MLPEVPLKQRLKVVTIESLMPIGSLFTADANFQMITNNISYPRMKGKLPFGSKDFVSGLALDGTRVLLGWQSLAHISHPNVWMTATAYAVSGVLHGLFVSSVVQDYIRQYNKLNK